MKVKNAPKAHRTITPKGNLHASPAKQTPMAKLVSKPRKADFTKSGQGHSHGGAGEAKAHAGAHC